MVKFQTTVTGAPVGCGYCIPKLAIPLTTLSIHLRISESVNNRFVVWSSTPKPKNNRRTKGISAADVNKQLRHMKRRREYASKRESNRACPHFAHLLTKKSARASQSGLKVSARELALSAILGIVRLTKVLNHSKLVEVLFSFLL